MAEHHARLATLVADSRLRDLPTPCLVVVADLVDANIAHLLDLLGSPRRARPHIKTARTRWAVARLRAAGINKVKASTPQEVRIALEAGMADVVLAYPAVGPALAEVGELALAHPGSRVSVLVDRPETVAAWPAPELGAFLDLDTGLGRTGVPVRDRARVLAVVDALRSAGIRLVGLHAYDGHLAGPEGDTRDRQIRAALAPALDWAGELDPPELVVGGSHTFLTCVAASDERGLAGIVAGSPGTVVYGDHRSVTRFAGTNRFAAAAVVLSRVVSAPNSGSVTVDAGLTAIQVDAGRPHFVVAGQPDWVAGEAAQEHAAVECRRTPGPGPSAGPAVGDLLPLVPFHIDTALAQFATAYVLSDGDLVREPIEVRHGR